MIRSAVLAIVLASTALGSAAATIRVIDGDTVQIDGERIRLATIDAPEIFHAKCDAEKRLGDVAKHRLTALLRSGPITIRRGDPADGRMKDRYGRTLARLYVGGEEVGAILVKEEMARLWTGHREPWCK